MNLILTGCIIPWWKTKLSLVNIYTEWKERRKDKWKMKNKKREFILFVDVWIYPTFSIMGRMWCKVYCKWNSSGWLSFKVYQPL